MYISQLLLSIFALVTVLSLSSAQIVSGPGYKNIKFDGASTYVTISQNVSQIAGKSFSIEAWILLDTATSSSGRPIVSRFDSSLSSPTDIQNDFVLQVNAQGYVILTLGGSTEHGIILISKNTISANVWYHVAFAIEYIDVSQTAPYRVSLFIDDYSSGKLNRDLESAFWYGPALPRVVLLNEPITLGKYVSSSQTFFAGEIDEVRVWQGARAGSDLKSYSFVSIENGDWRETFWALTGAQGGTSSNLLAASYNFNFYFNFNQETYDASQYSNDAIINGNFEVGVTDIQFIQYVRVQDEVPVQIPLYGLNSLNAASASTFNVYWTSLSELSGEVFNFDSLNSGNPDKTTPLRPAGIYTPGIGSIVANGSSPAGDSVVYILLPSSGATNARFRYWASVDGVKSGITEVRLQILCAGDRGSIDYCGICGGNNASLDACNVCFGDGSTCPEGCELPLVVDQCGVCGGNNSCLGCDLKPNSGLVYDNCGVCGGSNECGCDHQGGGVKDICGVCNGDNSTCGDCPLDDCLVPCGDGSTCTCVKYHGYHVQELDYLLLRWGFTNSIANINKVLADLEESLSLLKDYNGDLDLASVVKYFNNFKSDYLDEYDGQIDKFTQELNYALGTTSTIPN